MVGDEQRLPRPPKHGIIMPHDYTVAKAAETEYAFSHH